MPLSDDSAVLDAPTTAVVHKPLPHDSARLHVQGAATYIDDIGEPASTLHIAIGMANKASGKLKSLGLEAVRGALASSLFSPRRMFLARTTLRRFSPMSPYSSNNW